MLHDTPPPGFEARFTVVGACLEVDGRVLMLRRAEHKPEGGLWGLPAGKVDPGEALSTALVREVQEETGIILDAERLGESRTWYVVWPSRSFVWTVFRVALPQEPMISLRAEEHQGHVWLTPEAALDMEMVEDQDETFIQLYGLKH